MARSWRIEYDGALYHALSRGNQRQGIFFDDEDRERFLDTTGEMAERFAVEVCAYVLMDNHYHLLLGTPRHLGTGSLSVFSIMTAHGARLPEKISAGRLTKPLTGAGHTAHGKNVIHRRGAENRQAGMKEWQRGGL
jgi:hypothetical protein